MYHVHVHMSNSDPYLNITLMQVVIQILPMIATATVLNWLENAAVNVPRNRQLTQDAATLKKRFQKLLSFRFCVEIDILSRKSRKSRIWKHLFSLLSRALATSCLTLSVVQSKKKNITRREQDLLRNIYVPALALRQTSHVSN